MRDNFAVFSSFCFNFLEKLILITPYQGFVYYCKENNDVVY